MPGGDSAVVPPDPMPNSEVKRRSADGSVGLPHVRVGNCQVLNKAKGLSERTALFAVRHFYCEMQIFPHVLYVLIRLLFRVKRLKMAE